MATYLEHCRVGPKGTAELTLPLTFFDIFWIHFHPIQRLLFYEFPCSTSYFVETVVPKLKEALSLTLKHFTPLAGNLIYPFTSSTIPVFRYMPGDSVSLTIAQANEGSDFNNLTGNHSRNADDFYAFVPQLPPAKIESESNVIPILALQVTLFPNAGVSVGYTNHHSIGDANSIVGFIKAWSSIQKFGGDEQFLAGDSVPFYDRSVIKDPSGLAALYWNKMLTFSTPPPYFPTNKVRTTYVLQASDIRKLKEFLTSKKPYIVHLSSFTVTTAYVWTCLIKAAATGEEEVDGEEPEHFGFAVDARQRLDPPVPPTYFGNCLGIVFRGAAHNQLTGENGFLIAAELIADLITKQANKKDEILKDAEKWVSLFEEFATKRVCGVSGSPKFDLYESDYGWGKPKKFESVSIDGELAMSLSKSREFEGGLEIGLSLRKPKMDAFAAIFSRGLHTHTQ